MKKRMAMLILATALSVAACSSGSKGGSTSLPSIGSVSPTATEPSSPTPTSASPSASESVSATASPTRSASPSTSASATASPTRLAGGGCPSSALSLALGESQGAAGSQITPLVFTNIGATPCTLSGFPGVSFVTGDSGTQVGAPATRSGSAGPAVTLAPKGTAQALLKIADTANYGNSCTPVAVRGLRVYPPGQKSALFVALDDQTACSTLSQGAGPNSQLDVQSVTAG